MTLTTDALFEYGMMLPLTLAMDSKSGCVRMLGLLCEALWIVPAGVILFVPLLVCTFGWLVERTWKGEADGF